MTKRQSIRITQLLAVLQANNIHLPELEHEQQYSVTSPSIRSESSPQHEEYQAALAAQMAVLHQKLKEHRNTILQLTTSLEQHQRLVKEKGECIADLENENVGIRAQLDTFTHAQSNWVKEKNELGNKLVVYSQRMRVAIQERDRCQREIKSMQKSHSSELQTQNELETRSKESERSLRKLIGQVFFFLLFSHTVMRY